MTEHGSPTGPPRDVPPPRPVPADPEVAGGGVGGAARALADAVTGLLGRDPADSGSRASGASGRSAGGVLADVVSAVAGAARSGGGREATSPGAVGPAVAGAPGGRGTGAGRWAPGGLLTDLLDTAAPALPIRDRARLQAAHPGATEQEIADVLVARAARLTGGVGAATGGLAAAQWFAPPSLVAMPLEMGAQTVLVAAVEVVLVGELHELYRRPAPGDARERARAYLTSWSTQRAVGTTGSGGLFSRLSSAGAQALRRRVTRRLAGSATSFAPLLVGATLSARSNSKATVALAERVLADLRTGLPPSAPPDARP
ncbi:hypothetical protein [Modestobacter lapidis]